MEIFIPIIILLIYFIVCYCSLENDRLNLFFYIAFLAAFIAELYLCYLEDVSGILVLVIPLSANIVLLVIAAILRAVMHPYNDDSIFAYNAELLTGWDAKWATARYGEGFVRYDYKGLVGKKVIAFYLASKSVPGRFLVYDSRSRKEIGMIDTSQGLVYLSRYSEAARRGLDGSDEQICPEPRKLFAKLPWQLPPDTLLDARTGKLLGTFTGDKVGGAAAFIALTSQFHTNTEYAEYQTDWGLDA